MTSSSSPVHAGPISTESIRRLWNNGQQREAVAAALNGWEQLLRQGADLHWLENLLRRCGLVTEASVLQAHLTRARPADAESWAALVRSVLASGDPWWAHELLGEVGAQSRSLEALRIESALSVGDAAPLIRAWLERHRDDSARADAVQWWIRLGALDEADAILRNTPGLQIWRARLALWRDDADTAVTLLSGCEDSPEVRCLLAIAAVRQGRLETAECALRDLVDGEQRAQAYSWLATVLRKQGRYEEATRAADASSSADPTFNLTTRIEHALSDASLRASGRDATSLFSRTRRWVELRWRSIKSLEHAAALYVLGAKPNDPLSSLELLLERCAGNHTAMVTTVDSGRIRAHQVPIDPRHLGASIQRVLWTRGADAARALYTELAPSVNRHPLFLIYYGELELWLGAYDVAAHIFREALERNRKTRWAWIGLGASAMLQGDLAAAQRIWNQGRSFTDWRTGFAGPTLYAYRGECYRRQGNAARARRDLALAIRQKPQRLSARINMALLDDTSAEMEALIDECSMLAPILMEEFSGSHAARLEQVLEAMRGNRSSSSWQMTFHLWGHVWRRAT